MSKIVTTGKHLYQTLIYYYKLIYYLDITLIYLILLRLQTMFRWSYLLTWVWWLWRYLFLTWTKGIDCRRKTTWCQSRKRGHKSQQLFKPVFIQRRLVYTWLLYYWNQSFGVPRPKMTRCSGALLLEILFGWVWYLYIPGNVCKFKLNSNTDQTSQV